MPTQLNIRRNDPSPSVDPNVISGDDWFAGRYFLCQSRRMNLESSFDTIMPCVVGFTSKLERTRVGERPIFPTIIGTGFFVDPSGIAVTNRHVVEAFDKIPRHPTTGEFPIAAFVFLQGDAGKSMQFLLLEVKKWFGLQSFGSTGDWYGQTIPDVGFVQLGVREVPFLHLSTHIVS